MSLEDFTTEDALLTVSDGLQRLIDERSFPGIAVGIVLDQDLVWTQGFGCADLESGRQPDEHTLFRVASITKTFTMTAILQLRDAERLSLDDPMSHQMHATQCESSTTVSVIPLTRRRTACEWRVDAS